MALVTAHGCNGIVLPLNPDVYIKFITNSELKN